MNRRPLHKLAGRARIVLAVAVGIVLAGGATARAADPLPGQAVEIVHTSFAPPLSTPSGPYLTPADPDVVPAVDCLNGCPAGYEATWKALGVVAEFQEYAQGEYVGRARLPHVPVYRLRVDDQLEFSFRVDDDRLVSGYKLNVGDQIQVSSATDPSLERTLVVLPDGTISLPLVGQVPAAGLTVIELRDHLDSVFQEHLQDPSITVEPVDVNSKLEELRAAVAGRAGFRAQTLPGRVTPEGTIQLPAVGSVPAQGLSLDEFKMELDERFASRIQGMEVVPILSQKAPRYVYVVGEVRRPGRYELVAPTTAMQAITMAGSWVEGAEIRNVVVFRRADDWRLMATSLDLTRALLGKSPCPEGDIWISDADLIIVPRSKIQRASNFVDLVFVRGVYGVLPVNLLYGGFTYDFFKGPFFIPNLTP
ncbi:MAG: sugar ABC transporter substrate-binding protein [Planctomycetota bacterium]|nr:MAG: sugar ABC transporter substrate-binding protein [Planctomycetota bacterium]